MFEKISSWLQTVVESKTFDEAVTNFISTKYGQYALIFVFFMFIIIYLRVLFGPKGFFREKKWDDWNDEAQATRDAEKAVCIVEAKIQAEKKSDTTQK